MQDILVVVDMQNDFITGVLGTPEARSILPRVVEKVNGFAGEVICTLDTHGKDYMEKQEGRCLPVAHCVAGTSGHALCGELLALEQIRRAEKFEKSTFGSLALMEALEKRANTISSITYIGVCTDICVVSNVLLVKAALPEIPVIVDASCCAGVTQEKHFAALETLRSCQVQITGVE